MKKIQSNQSKNNNKRNQPEKYFLSKYYYGKQTAISYNQFLEEKRKEINQQEEKQEIHPITFQSRGYSLNEKEILSKYHQKRNEQNKIQFSIVQPNETNFVIQKEEDLEDEIPAWKKSEDSCDTIDLDALMEDDETDDQLILWKVSLSFAPQLFW